MKKSFAIIFIFTIFFIAFSGTFTIFNEYFLLESSPVLMAVGANSFGIGFVYSTFQIQYTETKIGFLKIKKPSTKEYLDFSVILGPMYGVYASIKHENLNYPVSLQSLEFFVTNRVSFISSQNKTFYALGPISINSESSFLNQNNDFGYSFSRYFGKYQNISGYFLKLDNTYHLGYLYPLDVSLEQGILAGLGTKDFNQLYLNLGIRKYFNAKDFKGFIYAYLYFDKDDIKNINYFSGLKFLGPLKGDLVFWDGKFSFRINW
jgi:hypothetical protein